MCEPKTGKACVFVVTYEDGGLLQELEACADYETARDLVREWLKDGNPADWATETEEDKDEPGLDRIYQWRRVDDEDGETVKIWRLAVIGPTVDVDTGYLTPGDDPSMPGGGPPIYHGPEERYGA